MIPFLYESNETAFGTACIGRLSDCISCVVTEERNGIYECKFVYPLTGALYDEIKEGRVIGCTHDDKKDVQPFDIYARSAPINGAVTFYAHHISYRLGNIILKPFTATSVTTALSKMRTETYNTNPFTYWTDKSTQGAFTISAPKNAKEALGGSEGSVLDVYGTGEYSWDKWAVKLHGSRGQDTQVEINYGVNLRDLVQDVDVSGTYTAVVPFWKSFEGELVTLPEGILTSQEAQQAGYTDIIPATMDLSAEWSDKPTVAQLRQRAQALLDGNKPWIPDETIEVDFVALWQTEQYEPVAALQKLSLCDTAVVSYPAMGIKKARMKIVRTEYDVLRERFARMEFGKARTSFSSAVKASTEEVLTDVPTRSALQEAVDHATDLITGTNGGYLKINTNADGEPTELLIMDSDDAATAVHVWRFNLGGWGHSSTGINGPYTSAATLDGGIVADYITAGTLRGLEINNGNGTFHVDTTGHVTASSATITNGLLNNGNGTFRVDANGNVTANSLSSNNATITGGSFNVSTSDKDQSIIQLNSGIYSMKMSPFSLLQYSNNQMTTGLSSTGLVVYYNGSVRARLTLEQLELYGNNNTRLIQLYPATVPYINLGATTANHIHMTSNMIELYDSNNVRRVALSVSGLNFYDSSGTLHKSYPA